MEYLKRLSEWSDLDWSILLLTLGVSLIVWSILLLILHIAITRTLLRKQKDSFDKKMRPYFLGDRNETIKEQFQQKNKEDW